VKNKQFLGLDFDRQKIIGNYIVDFLCKDLGFVVEIDGFTHDDKENYDKKRDNYLKNLGLKVFHIPDKEIKNNLDGIIQWLKKEVVGMRKMNTPSSDEDTPLQEGMNTPSSDEDTPLQEGMNTPSSDEDTPLQEGNGIGNSPSVKGWQTKQP